MIYRRNPLLMTVVGANPGRPQFIVIDSVTGEVMYTKLATGVGSQAINSCAEVARRLATRNGRSYIVFLDMSRTPRGSRVHVGFARTMGITEEVHPDGRVTRGNPRRVRVSPDRALDQEISDAWHRQCSGIQVPIMDIPRIFRDVRLEVSAGMTVQEAVSKAAARYRVNRNPFGEAVVAGVAGALVNRVLQRNPGLEDAPCELCGGELQQIGTLGNREHYRCRSCGAESSCQIEAPRRAPAPRPRGRRRGYRQNPAIARSWDGLKGRPRLAILEFAGIPYDQAKRLASRAWSTLPPSIQTEVSKGWQENPKYRARYLTPSMESREETIRARGLNHAMKKANRRAEKLPPAFTAPRSSIEVDRIYGENPGPRGKRKITMTVERFANWVRAKRDPKMWKAFLQKFKGYEKWTHGSKARKVTVEWVDTPGVDGLWITYDGGKQPESTYIMPKGAKRTGAWKHPWGTMPDIKHDPQAKIVITKLRGQSKISDFYHK